MVGTLRGLDNPASHPFHVVELAVKCLLDDHAMITSGLGVLVMNHHRKNEIIPRGYHIRGRSIQIRRINILYSVLQTGERGVN